MQKINNQEKMAPPRQKYESLSNKIKWRIQTLHQTDGKKVSDIINNPQLKLKKFLKDVPKSTIYNIAKTPITEEGDKRVGNTHAGRKNMIKPIDLRAMERKIKKLHLERKNFNSKELQTMCGLERQVSNLTFRRNLKKLGYECLTNRKKGILSDKDKAKRVKYAKQIIKDYGKGAAQKGFWREILYTDIVGYEWKVSIFLNIGLSQVMVLICKNVSVGHPFRGTCIIIVVRPSVS